MTTTIAQRPSLQDMVKSAMAGTAARASITSEAIRQMAIQDEEPGEDKTASAALDQGEHYSTEHIHKLASALEFIEETIKTASPALSPGHGPGALEVSESAKGNKPPLEPGHSGQAIPKNQPPKSPALQAEKVQGGKANTGLETNDEMKHPKMQHKTASAVEELEQKNRERFAKLAQKGGDCMPPKAPIEKKASGVDVAMIRKLAEDAINPASISAGKATPPDASASGEGVPSEPGDVTSQKRMIASNQAAIDYTKGQAKAQPKREVSQLLAQPALTTAGDNVLQQTLSHTGEAGVKIAQDALRVKAARALLSNLIEKVASEEEKKSGKKKESTGMAPASPSAASGFNASSL